MLTFRISEQNARNILKYFSRLCFPASMAPGSSPRQASVWQVRVDCRYISSSAAYRVMEACPSTEHWLKKTAVQLALLDLTRAHNLRRPNVIPIGVGERTDQSESAACHLSTLPMHPLSHGIRGLKLPPQYFGSRKSKISQHEEKHVQFSAEKFCGTINVYLRNFV
jgi:hypothetical protein